VSETPSSTSPRSRQTGRSPAYPGISLRVAIERARLLYEKERRHAAPISAITAAWGLTSSTSGSATVAIAALKKYGLLVEEKSGGERVARLSDLALDVLLNPEPEAAIKQAALMPAINREMWEQYGTNLPSADTLRWQLVKRGFTENGVQDFLRVYRDTIAFAKLDSSAPGPALAEGGGDEDEELYEESGPTHFYPRWNVTRQDRTPSEPTPGPPLIQRDPRREPQSSGGLRIPIPLVGGTEVVYLEGRFPISEEAWNQFQIMLSAMKAGLVKPSTQAVD